MTPYAMPSKKPGLHSPCASRCYGLDFAGARAQATPPGPRVDTTLDVGISPALSNCWLRLGVLPERVSMATLVVDSRSLAVRAYAGSADFSDNGRFAHVDMVQGKALAGFDP